MFCKNCGKEVNEGANFCPICGTAIDYETLTEQSNNEPLIDKEKRKNPTAKILIAILVFVVGIFIGVKLMGDSDKGNSDVQPVQEEQKSEAAVPVSSFSDDLIVGNIVTFGVYEQDGNLNNGPEPIEWDVIGRAGNRYLLISHYILDCQPYLDRITLPTSSTANATWGTSYIREWLNSDFYNSAFGEDEKNIIITNSTYGDTVFLLSRNELINYYGAEIIEDGEGRITALSGLLPCGATEYAKQRGVNVKIFNSAGLNQSYYLKEIVDAYNERVAPWLLASDISFVNDDKVTAFLVDYTGAGINYTGYSLWDSLGIRPAIGVQSNKTGNDNEASALCEVISPSKQ